MRTTPTKDLFIKLLHRNRDKREKGHKCQEPDNSIGGNAKELAQDRGLEPPAISFEYQWAAEQYIKVVHLYGRQSR